MKNTPQKSQKFLTDAAGLAIIILPLSRRAFSSCSCTRAYSFGAKVPVWRGRYGGYAADGRMPEKQTGGADMRVKITLACSECKQRNYETKKNKKNDPDRLEMNKYCRFCNKHTLHRETK